jgi:site-specific DNA recombinase
MILGNDQKAGLYIRVSSDEQAEKGSSLTTQEARLREECQRAGIPVAGVYADDGYSGATMHRPGLYRLLEDARKGLFNLALVYKLDRLSRNLKDAVNLVLGDLESCGVAFRSITEAFNTLEPAGKVMFANLASFADYEREQIRERCNRGRMQKNREGKFTGGRLPYGIGWDKDREVFYVVEEEARIYRRIFELFVKEGLSQGQTAERLGAEGALTRAGVSFSPTQLSHLLRSPAAVGDWFRHRVTNRFVTDPLHQRKFDSPTYEKRGCRSKEEWVRIALPAIIPADLWERAQSLLAVKRQPHTRPPTALCLGVIFCGECGRRVGIHQQGSRSRVYRRYGCYARIYNKRRRHLHYKGDTCAMPFFHVKTVDENVWAKVEELISNPATLWDAVYGEDAGAGREALLQRMKDLSRQLGAAKAQEERAARLYTLGTAPVMAEKQVKEAAARRQALERELEQAEGAWKRGKAYQEVKEQAFQTLSILRNEIMTLSPEEKRRAIQTLFPGGLTHRLELQMDGSITARGIIDVAMSAPAMSLPQSDVCYLK